MEINKGKILVYVLTFAAYTWTGYGSGILGHLKDAVITAEGFFGEFLEKAVDIVKNIKDVKQKIDSTVGEKCIFECPNGIRPKPNKYHKPFPNGCGPQGMKIDTEGLPLPDMTHCCNEHDICYSTCNKDKDKCDNEFKKCLYKICDKITELGFSQTCQAAAKVLFTGTTALGCSFYLEAQREACFCGDKRSKNEL